MRTRTVLFGAGVVAVFLLARGCYVMRPVRGGASAEFEAPRSLDPADVAVPAGYAVEVVARGLTFPTGVAFDEAGRAYVTESGYCYGEVFTTPRLLRVDADGTVTPIATAPVEPADGGSGPRSNGPWNGVAYADGAFYVSEGGVVHGGAILRIDPDGSITRLIGDLPSRGDHHVNGPAIGPDGWIYFGIGSATNSAVVGEDSATFGWLARDPSFHDIPGMTIVLAGENFETDDVRAGRSGRVETGAFQPFGTPSHAGQRLEGRVPCTAAVLRVAREGGEPQLVAWGLRNPFGLAFSPDGRLYVTENGFDDRGSRPIWGAADVLWAITPGQWYGWPDYSEGRPVTDEEFDPVKGRTPKQLLSRVPNQPPQPVALFGCHSSANGFDFSRNEAFGHVGDAFVALFGDQVPGTGKLLQPVGFKVVRVELDGGLVHDFLVNRGDTNGPASFLDSSGIERPVAVRFDPSGTSLYVVDFGVLLQDGPKAQPHVGTGALWRVTRTGAPPPATGEPR